MSKNPNLVAALKRRTSNYNVGTPGSSRAVRTPSMRSTVLDREFGTPRGSSRATSLMGSVRHSYLNRSFVRNDSFDTESVDSIEMKDLRNTEDGNNSLRNSAGGRNLKNSAGGSRANLKNSAGGSCVTLRNSAEGRNLRNSADGSRTNVRNSAGGSSISLRNSADGNGDGRNLRNCAGGSCVNLRNSAGGNVNGVINSTAGNGAISKNSAGIKNEGSVNSANGNDFREVNDSSVGNDYVYLVNSEGERGVNLNKSGVMNLKNHSVRRGSVNLRSCEVADATFSPLLNASHLQRKLLNMKNTKPYHQR